MGRLSYRLAALAFLACAGHTLPSIAQSADCTSAKCHAGLTQKRVVHGAVPMGCPTCHGKLDARSVPHKSIGASPKGLSAEGPALCAACHEGKLFRGKFVHGPVAAGNCGLCHSPHASDHAGLLVKEPAALCLDCHAEVRRRPHVVVGFSGGGHPMGEAKKAVADPLRGGKPFYCVACHEPHRSELPKLGRFERGMASCQKCHKI